ncbi:Puromycin-sensitive aminopeptidase [Pseudolycoriella hygida]|uniref:Puromycin-sensitive aminopeptidase n=1 Tax=Pseudolycoriella hygida TaxID=35572 RepID=A0A9Q0MQH0_9DIPT|nr:Puromycin-sensitive aminopeptidase [Pseudolycoriella hygida]
MEGRFALGVAKKCIEWCNNYFGIDFPLKKCDLIAIDRFYAYAMENWGLIMFREEAILYDPEKTSSETKDNIALLIGHEVSHMWFGDLATMHWWSDIWLKEGVADFIMYLSIGELYPELQTWHHYQSDVLLQSMKMDALNSSHPIEIETLAPYGLNSM